MVIAAEQFDVGECTRKGGDIKGKHIAACVLTRGGRGMPPASRRARGYAPSRFYHSVGLV